MLNCREMEKARGSLEAELKHSENSFAGTIPTLTASDKPQLPFSRIASLDQSTVFGG